MLRSREADSRAVAARACISTHFVPEFTRAIGIARSIGLKPESDVAKFTITHKCRKRAEIIFHLSRYARKNAIYFAIFPQGYTGRCAKYVLLDTFNIYRSRCVYEKARFRSTISRHR